MKCPNSYNSTLFSLFSFGRQKPNKSRSKSTNGKESRHRIFKMVDLSKQIIDRHGPAWDCGFGLGNFTPAINLRIVWCAGPVDFDNLVSQ